MSSYYLSVEEVAKIYGVEEQTVRDWANTNKIKGTKIGKKWFFSRNHIYTLHSEEEARKILGEEAVIFNHRAFDILFKNVRFEVKSSNLKKTSLVNGEKKFWHFVLNEERDSDFYMLLGFNEDRSKILKVFSIPTAMIFKLKKEKHQGISIPLEDKSFDDYMVDLSGKKVVL